ncbi:NAD(P)H-dependent oxidoreductase [Paracoccus jiaweipingae]|uniref:NAD(P)H-dependent oxidoreductase n=1 Tax=unclassified Paracoccus (in: a-proteobacteria) TaxID=2688777 RepID=UPI0037B19F5D
MQVLLIDGHPDDDRLSAHLLDAYAAALPAGTGVTRLALRDLRFDPVLHRGYRAAQPLEPDLSAATQQLLAADHIVLAHPLWWGAEPALVKGFYDRVFLPGTTFRYHDSDPFWDGLLKGRSADLLVTLDTPEFWLRLRFGNPFGRRMRHQVWGFCGVAPLRTRYFGPVRRGGAAKRMAGWQRQVQRLAQSSAGLGQGRKA